MSDELVRTDAHLLLQVGRRRRPDAGIARRPRVAHRHSHHHHAWERLPPLSMAEYDEPVAWLWSVLKAGELRSTFIQRQAKEYGISAKMLRRARRVLKVEIRAEGCREKFNTIWSLPKGQT